MATLRGMFLWCTLVLSLGGAHFMPVSTAKGGSLLIRKCCPESQQLARTLSKCVAYAGHHGNPGRASRRSVAAVRAAARAHFPWWMDSSVAPLAPDSLQHVASFLEGQNEGDYIEFNAAPLCDIRMSAVIDSRRNVYALLHNGNLVYYPQAEDKENNITFSPASYCTDRVDWAETNETVYLYILCPCLESACARKCCSAGQILSLEKDGYRAECVNSGGNTKNIMLLPQLYIDYKPAELDVEHLYMLLEQGLNRSNDRTVIQRFHIDLDFWMFANCSILVESATHGSQDHYCGDLVPGGDGAEPALKLFGCEQSLDAASVYGVNNNFGIVPLIGIIPLVATLAVFAILPEIRNEYSKIVISHTVCLLMAYILVASGRIKLLLPHSVCIARAFCIQFFLLATSFWFNVMCIDVAWAFSAFRPHGGRRVSEREGKKFLVYSLYGWGFPAIISAVTAIMYFVDSIPNSVIKPSFRFCWFSDKNATLAYFYGPTLAVTAMNFLLLLYTIVSIVSAQCDTAILDSSESGRHEGSALRKEGRTRLMLYVNLLFLSGPPRLLEIISWAGGSMDFYWYVFDFLSLLRAVFIFVFVCGKRHVPRLLLQRLRPAVYCAKIRP